MIVRLGDKIERNLVVLNEPEKIEEDRPELDVVGDATAHWDVGPYDFQVDPTLYPATWVLTCSLHERGSNDAIPLDRWKLALAGLGGREIGLDLGENEWVAAVAAGEVRHVVATVTM